VVGQDEKTVAVYMTGQEPKGALGSHKKIGNELVDVINNSGKFSAINITNNLKNLRGGVVSNELIKSIALRFGVQYLCIVKISEVTSSMFKLDARLVDAETTQTINTTTIVSDLSNSRERVNIARKIAQKLMDVLVDVPEDVEENVQPESYTNNTTTITVDSNLTLTSNHQKQPECTLTYNVNPTYLRNGSKTTTWYVGEQITVTAAVIPGYTFTGWSGASSSTRDNITITMDGNLTLTANYQEQPKYILTVNANPTYGGIVSRSPQYDTYTVWEEVTVTAIPYGGYTFSHWSGTLSSTNNRMDIIMNRDFSLTANFQKQYEMSFGIGVFTPLNFGGGIKWSNGEEVTMPYYGIGGYLFFDAVYAEAFIGAGYFGDYWESTGASELSGLPDMQRSYINLGVFVKYPIGDEEFKLFPLMGIDYEASIFSKLKYENGREYMFDGKNGHFQANSLSVLWIKFGVGYDSYRSDNVYLRGEFLYGFRTVNEFENKYTAKNSSIGVSGNTRLGHGLTMKLGLGFIL